MMTEEKLRRTIAEFEVLLEELGREYEDELKSSKPDIKKLERITRQEVHTGIMLASLQHVLEEK